MSIVISQQSLLPIRRDGQIATGNFSTSGGMTSGGGTCVTLYTGGTNICVGTGTTITINLCGTVASANNSICLGGYVAACYINCQVNCLCVAHSETSTSANYAATAGSAGSVVGAVMGNDDGAGNQYLIKWCSHSGGTKSRFYDNGTCACINATLCATCFQGNINGTASNSLGLCGCTPSCFLAVGGTANNSNCLGGYVAACYINCQANCLSVAHSETSTSANYAATAGSAGSVTGAVMGADDGSGLNYLIKWNSHSGGTKSRFYDNGTSACINATLCASCFQGNLNGTVTGTATCATTAGNSLCLGGSLACNFAPLASPTFTNKITISGSAPYIDIYDSGGWVNHSYIQNGVTYNGASAPGNFMAFMNPASKGFSFMQAGTSRLHINTDGNVGIGTIAPYKALHIYGANAGLALQSSTSPYDHWLISSLDTNNSLIFGNDDSGSGTVMSFTRAGAACFYFCVTASDFILSSDERLKTNIENLSISKALNTEYKSFEMCDNIGQKRVGVIAQQLQEVAPEFVHTDDKGFLSVSYTDLFASEIAYLKCEVKGLKEYILFNKK